jgi:hypothetical protein
VDVGLACVWGKHPASATTVSISNNTINFRIHFSEFEYSVQFYQFISKSGNGQRLTHTGLISIYAVHLVVNSKSAEKSGYCLCIVDCFILLPAQTFGTTRRKLHSYNGPDSHHFSYDESGSWCNAYDRK